MIRVFTIFVFVKQRSYSGFGSSSELDEVLHHDSGKKANIYSIKIPISEIQGEKKIKATATSCCKIN